MKSPQFLQDIDGATSSKRVAAFWALGLFSIAVVVDLILALKIGRPPSEFIINALMVIVTGGFLTATAERFAPNRETKEEPKEN